MQNEQQQILLETKEYTNTFVPHSRQWQHIFCTTKARNLSISVLLMLCITSGIIVAYYAYNVNKHNHVFVTDELEGNDSREKEIFELKSYTRYEPELPKSIGYMNIYIRKPIPNGNRQPFQRFQFPTACYRRHEFPLTDSLISIMPWTNIYFDRRSRQTIIYSLKGGVCILPSLINVYDEIFSVAELIASGYASLVRSGVKPIRSIDVTFYFKPMKLSGPGIPKINDLTGIFEDGVRTRYGSFPIRKHQQEMHVDVYPTSESEDEDRYDRTSNSRNNYYRQQGPRPQYSKTRKTTVVTTSTLTTTLEPVPRGIIKIVINPSTATIAPSENPTFEGITFGSVGAYEKIRGIAYGQLDPSDKHNSKITDLQLAPRNAVGMVEYSMDFYILKPVNLINGNHKLFFEVNNRGGKLFGSFAQMSGGNNPTNASHAGQAFLMKQGYTIAWCGWDPSVPSTGSPDLLRIYLPIATNSDGTSITGPSYEYIVFDNPTTMSYTTSYRTVSTDTTKAKLTVKDHLIDSPKIISSSDWIWTSDNTISLLPLNTTFKQSSIYELVYTAKDPYVAAIGFAATRDFVSFLRSSRPDNPLAGDVTRVLSWSLSQPARYMNDFIWLGFNENLEEEQVFDGVFNWIGAGTGIGLNYRFAQSARTERNRQNHLYPEAPFPFSYTTLNDSGAKIVDGRNIQCTKTNTCPKIMNIISSNEYWVKTGSLLHSDVAGHDVTTPSNVRNYLISGTQHGGASSANSRGICQQFGNTVDANPALRALYTALDQWIDGRSPPPSMIPSNTDKTAVFSSITDDSPLGIGIVPQAALNWPTIPSVLYTGLVTVRNRFDFGRKFSKGIISFAPPKSIGVYYPSFVSKVDSDGNELAGIRLPPVVVPVATYTGWNLRSVAYGGDDGCESTGSTIPFAPDKVTRIAKGDSRLSLEERYSTRNDYEKAIAAAANTLAQLRLLLPDDVQAYITASQKPIQVINNPTYDNYTW